MPTGREWVQSQRWLENTEGIGPTDEIVGFVDNEEVDAHGFFGRYSAAPTYDGQPIDPALLYGDGWESQHRPADPDPRPVTSP